MALFTVSNVITYHHGPVYGGTFCWNTETVLAKRPT